MKSLLSPVVLLLACKLVAEPWRASPPEIDEEFIVVLPDVHAETAASGLTVMASPSAENGLVHVAIVMRAGYDRDPPGKEGLARVAASLLERWSRAPDNDERFGELGARPSVSVTRRGLTIGVEVLPWEAERATTLLATLVADARSSLAAFDVAKAEALAGLGGMRGDPKIIATFAVARVLRPTAQHLANLGYGSASSVASISAAEVEQHLVAACNTKEAALVVTGNVEPDDPARWATGAFAAWPSTPPRPLARTARAAPQQGEVVFVPMAGMQQTLIVASGTRPSRNHPDAMAFDAAYDLLSGRTQAVLREMLRVSYGVQSLPAEDGTFMMALAVRSDSTRVALREIQFALHQTIGELPPGWLQHRRIAVSGSMMLRAQDAGAVADHVADVFLREREPDSLQRSLAALQKLEAQDVESSAENHFERTRVRIVVVGDPAIAGQLPRDVEKWSIADVFTPAG